MKSTPQAVLLPSHRLDMLSNSLQQQQQQQQQQQRRQQRRQRHKHQPILLKLGNIFNTEVMVRPWSDFRMFMTSDVCIRGQPDIHRLKKSAAGHRGHLARVIAFG